MKKAKHNNPENGIIILLNWAIGVVLWLLFGGIMSWLVSSERLSESSGIAIAPFAQGIITYVITIMSYFSMRGEKWLTPLVTPLIYVVAQFCVALLFWEIDINGLIRSCIAVACGALLSMLTYKMRKNPKKTKAFLRYSR